MKKKNLVIDAHHHWMPEEHYRKPNPLVRKGERVVREPDRFRIYRGKVQLFSPPIMTANMADQIKEMDRVGVDQAVLHVGCWLDWINIKSSRFVNDKMAEVNARFPGRIIPLAHVPALDSRGREELRRAIKRLGFHGVGINTHIKGTLLDHKDYYPFYRAVSDLGIPIFVHPSSEIPLSHPHGMEDFNLTRNLGRAFDNTINITRLMFSGTLDRFPKLRFVFTHLGGAFFALKNRLNPSFWDKRPKGFFDKYQKRIFIDTAPSFWSPEEIRFAVHMVGEGQVLMGSDYPTVPFLRDAVRIVRQAKVSSQVKRKVLGENILRLFR
ncbi:MAG: amidohydrolase family protein [Candidatus Binatia bacterium]|jgi:hypothetical protein|nr:amidohydrolase family protein [Candidatus Binatia bacterium]